MNNRSFTCKVCNNTQILKEKDLLRDILLCEICNCVILNNISKPIKNKDRVFREKEKLDYLINNQRDYKIKKTKNIMIIEENFFKVAGTISIIFSIILFAILVGASKKIPIMTLTFLWIFFIIIPLYFGIIFTINKLYIKLDKDYLERYTAPFPLPFYRKRIEISEILQLYVIMERGDYNSKFYKLCFLYEDGDFDSLTKSMDVKKMLFLENIIELWYDIEDIEVVGETRKKYIT